MNLNLELHLKPSCSLLKHQKEQGSAILPSEPGTTSSLSAHKPHPVTRAFLPPALIFPYLLLLRRLLRLRGPWLLSEPRERGSLFPSRPGLPAPLLSAAAHGAPGDAPLRLFQSHPRHRERGKPRPGGAPASPARETGSSAGCS